MKLRFVSDAPGSHGETVLEATAQEWIFLERLIEKFNSENPGHAAPLLSLEPCVPDFVPTNLSGD